MVDLSKVPFKPSQVTPCDRWLPKPASSFVPFVDTFKRAEAEFAAALIVRGCEARGDAWEPLRWSDLVEVLRADVEAKRKPWSDWLTNPFYRPDMHALVAGGWAEWEDNVGGAGLFTQAGFTLIADFVKPADAAPVKEG